MSRENTVDVGHFYAAPIFTKQLLGNCPDAVRGAFYSFAPSQKYATKEIVIKEGDLPKILVLDDGEAELRIYSKINNKEFNRKIGLGELVGVTEVLSGNSFEFSVMAKSRCTFSLIESTDFCRFLTIQPERCFTLLKLLGSRLNTRYRAFCSTKF